MAFNADYSERDYPEVSGAYVRIQSYQEYQKNCILAVISIWRASSDVLSGQSPVTLRRYFIDSTALDISSGIRTGIYNLLKQDAAYSNITDNTDVVVLDSPIPT